MFPHFLLSIDTETSKSSRSERAPRTNHSYEELCAGVVKRCIFLVLGVKAAISRKYTDILTLCLFIWQTL